LRLGNKLRIRYLFVGYLGIFLGFAIYSVYAYFFTPSVLIVTILGFWLVALLSYTLGAFLEIRDDKLSLDTSNYFTKLVEKHKDITEEDLELIFGKQSDILSSLLIFLIGLVAIEVPKEIAGIQPFGTALIYTLSIGGIATIVLALAYLTVKKLNPLRVQSRNIEDFLAAKKIIREKQSRRVPNFE